MQKIVCANITQEHGADYGTGTINGSNSDANLWPGSTIVGMSSKKLVWLGFFVGSTIGGMVPTLWGDEIISLSAIVLSTLGGIGGIWAGVRLGQTL